MRFFAVAQNDREGAVMTGRAQYDGEGSRMAECREG